ncbi:hypothetical protein [Mycobacterium sp. C31M]
MAQCNTTFDGLAHQLGGFTCVDAPAIVNLRNPLGLSNATMPVLELLMVAGAGFALWWAVRRAHRAGDPTNLVLWFAAVVYLLTVEIPLYFPDGFGVQDHVGVVFAHNVFGVQFMYDRLPLYIVSLYPALAVLAHEIVRALGVFRDRGLVIGAVCVGFVHHCFYEVFDQLGPQLRWWAWNTDNPMNHPMLASVPMTSVVIFAALGPGVLVLLVRWLVREDRTYRRLALTWRALVAGMLVPLGLVILSIPYSIFGGADPNTTAQAVVFSVELVLIAVIAVPVLWRQWRVRRPGRSDGNLYIAVFGSAYLGVLTVLWVIALTAYFGAVDGVTADGTPTGSLLYATVCLVVAALCVAAAGGAAVSGHRRALVEHR